jgi:crossover junction endodeoxyribonuclease RuvC
MTSSNNDCTIIAIDPGTRITGYALIKVSHHTIELLDFGCIKPPVKASLSDRYLIINESIEELIIKYGPHEMAIETQFVAENAQSALKLGIAFGMALISGKKRGLKVFGYSPREVKCAVTGTGNASKSQLQGSVARSLRLKILPQPQDAADALAIALCHNLVKNNKLRSLSKKEF